MKGTRDGLTSFISFVHRSLTTHFVFCFFQYLKKRSFDHKIIVHFQSISHWTIIHSSKICSKKSFIVFFRSSFQKSILSVKNLSFFKAFGKFVRSEKKTIVYLLFDQFQIARSFLVIFSFLKQSILFVKLSFFLNEPLFHENWRSFKNNAYLYQGPNLTNE